jgi:hypothetical protein
MSVVLRRVAILASVPVVVALTGCNRPAQPPGEDSTAAPAAAPAQDPVERGRLLIAGGGCHDCHTPKKLGPMGPEPDMDLALSGHPESAGVPQPFKQGAEKIWTTHTNDHLTAWSGAWGVTFAANLTPDQNTGLGIWTEQMFVDAIKNGKHMGTARPILPPMPWQQYRELPEEDLKAMFAYLKSLKPIANRVPVPLDPAGKPIEEPQ